jgi:hypothetical protein
MLKTSSGQTALAGLEKKLAGSVPADSDVPRSVRTAVRLMLSGGAVQALLGVFAVIVTIADKNMLTGSNGKQLTGSELTGGIVYEIVAYLVIVVVWVLMARFNRAGQAWAKWVASGLAALSTIETYSTVNGLKGGETITVLDIVFIVGMVVLWVIGVLAVAMLWRSESGEYYRARRAARLR